MAETLAATESLESVSHCSAVTSHPVSIGMCGKNWRDIVDDDKKVGTYGACAGKLCGADNISSIRKKKAVITVEIWRRREALRGGEMPSVIQQAVTHLIYLPVDHRGPVSYLAVVPTRPADPKVRSTLTSGDQTFWDKTGDWVQSGFIDLKLV